MTRPAVPDQSPTWIPKPEDIERSHLVELMDVAGVSTYIDLHRWSVEEPDEFWPHVIDRLGIEFVTQPSGVRVSDDPEQPGWLPGAEYNIVASCLDHDEGVTAIIAPGDAGIERVTVGRLRDEVGGFAAGLVHAGFGKGDRIAIAMPMTVEAVVAYLAIVAIGGVVVSIADSFAPDEIATRFAITTPDAVVTQDVAERAGRSLPMYAKLIDADAPPAIVVDTGAGLRLRDGDRWWSDTLVESAVFEPVAMAASDHTNILFSSGTTGEPKAIPWTQTTPIKAAMDGRYHHDIHAGDVVAWPTNLGWMMGPWLIYASLLNEAAMALYPDAPTTPDFIEYVHDAGVTMLGTVPSIVSAWREAGALERGDWTDVRVISSTGEASNPDDYGWLMRAAGDVPVIEYCGGTEIGGGYITATILDACVPSRFTTPALGLDFVLIDDEGIEGDLGEVFIAGPSIGLSTELLNRDHHQVYFTDTPLHPSGPLRRHGDQIQRLPDGRYRTLGRVDDTMNLGGIKVSSAEIEEVAASIDGVVEVAAIAVPPTDGGPDRLVLFAVYTDDADVALAPDAMQRAVRQHLNPLFRIHDVIPVDALPRTASQKVMRRVLRDRYE